MLTNNTGKILIEAVVFDYGNVLCLPQQNSDVISMASLSGIAVPRFEELYWRFRQSYDRGHLKGNAYWNSIAREEGRQFSDEAIAELILLDKRGWSRPNEQTLLWLEQLHRANVRLALLSNMPLELSHHMAKSFLWLSQFQHLIFSCDLGHVKPDPIIYYECLAKLQLPAERVLFLDDRIENVETACTLGFHSFVFENMQQASAVVSERFHLPIPSSLRSVSAN